MPADESSQRHEDIGHRLRSRRLALGLSEEAVAAALGVTCDQLQKYERGHGHIDAARLQHVADVLKAPVLFFFGGASGAREGNQGRCEIVDFAGRNPDAAKPDPDTLRIQRPKVESG
jgi:transcriptional regulator with XRE-family HTH domain